MNSSKTLGLVLLTPAIILVVLFFLAPVVLTAVFSFTNMSTATGISGGAYQLVPSSLQKLQSAGLDDLAKLLAEPKYIIDEPGLAALEADGVAASTVAELRRDHLGTVFATRREAERAIRGLSERPSTREVKQISEHFNRSLASARFTTREQLLSAIAGLGVTLSPAEQDTVAAATYTGWIWTDENFRRLVASPDTARSLINTLIYVGFVLVLFNTSFAMLLAISTHYMPEAPGGIFRSLWLLPRITPPVIYVLMWKWLAWDTGFLSMLLAPLGVPPRNWLLDSAANAWVFVVLINGFVGASMGMLIFASALKAIPPSQFHASEVDGASRWQQIRHIILPQLRWPILFVTCYQTLSLLTSFDLILLSTEGGPGGATEVWALAIYHTALNNYAGNLRYGYGTAMALLLVIIGIVLALVYLKFFNYRALLAKPLIER